MKGDDEFPTSEAYEKVSVGGYDHSVTLRPNGLAGQVRGT